MKIATVGAGKIGGIIGERWAKAGHEVVYGLRDPSKRKDAKPIGQALDGAEAVLLALPGSATAGFVREHAKALDGRIILDATNTLGAAKFNSWPELTAAIPTAQLYRAFNTLGWDVLANPLVGGVQADLFYCGPEGSGREVVEQLISGTGLRPIWVGGVDQVDTVDGVLRLWAVLSRIHGRRIAFKLISD
ncbi:MAG: NAD(P)-binding domain-containing protein [Candidatus Dormibacteraeota bacterium]|nr:NAD(P)-binding domain-containing protein [Candidatus Dormibacteraeota bacterium]